MFDASLDRSLISTVLIEMRVVHYDCSLTLIVDKKVKLLYLKLAYADTSDTGISKF